MHGRFVVQMCQRINHCFISGRNHFGLVIMRRFGSKEIGVGRLRLKNLFWTLLPETPTVTLYTETVGNGGEGGEDGEEEGKSE